MEVVNGILWLVCKLNSLWLIFCDIKLGVSECFDRMQAYQSAVSSGEFSCKLCGQNFSNATSLQIHEQYSHAPINFCPTNEGGVASTPPIPDSVPTPPTMHHQAAPYSQLPAYSQLHGHFGGQTDAWSDQMSMSSALTSVPENNAIVTPGYLEKISGQSAMVDTVDGLSGMISGDTAGQTMSNSEMSSQWSDHQFPPTPDSSGFPSSCGSVSNKSPASNESAEILDLDSNRVQVYTMAQPPSLPPNLPPAYFDPNMQFSSGSFQQLPRTSPVHRLPISEGADLGALGSGYSPIMKQFDRQAGFNEFQPSVHQTHENPGQSSHHSALQNQSFTMVARDPISQPHRMQQHALAPVMPSNQLVTQDNISAFSSRGQGVTRAEIDLDKNCLASNVAQARRTKTYHCDVCDKRFTSMGHLKRHFNTIVHRQTKEGKRTIATSSINDPLMNPNNRTNIVKSVPEIVNALPQHNATTLVPVSTATSVGYQVQSTADTQQPVQLPMTPPLQDTPELHSSSSTNNTSSVLESKVLQPQPTIMTSHSIGAPQQQHENLFEDQQLNSRGGHDFSRQQSDPAAHGSSNSHSGLLRQSLSSDGVRSSFQPYSHAVSSFLSSNVATSVTSNTPITNQYYNGYASVASSLNNKQYLQENIKNNLVNFSEPDSENSRDNSPPLDMKIGSSSNSVTLVRDAPLMSPHSSLASSTNATIDCCGHQFTSSAILRQHIESCHRQRLDLVEYKGCSANGCEDGAPPTIVPRAGEIQLSDCNRCKHRHPITISCSNFEQLIVQRQQQQQQQLFMQQQARRHQCETCDKVFTHYSDLKRHRYTHLAEKPFLCPHCGRGFIRRDQMEKHMLTHEQQQHNHQHQQQGEIKDSCNETPQSAYSSSQPLNSYQQSQPSLHTASSAPAVQLSWQHMFNQPGLGIQNNEQNTEVNTTSLLSPNPGLPQTNPNSTLAQETGTEHAVTDSYDIS